MRKSKKELEDNAQWLIRIVVALAFIGVVSLIGGFICLFNLMIRK